VHEKYDPDKIVSLPIRDFIFLTNREVELDQGELEACNSNTMEEWQNRKNREYKIKKRDHGRHHIQLFDEYKKTLGRDEIYTQNGQKIALKKGESSGDGGFSPWNSPRSVRSGSPKYKLGEAGGRSRGKGKAKKGGKRHVPVPNRLQKAYIIEKGLCFSEPRNNAFLDIINSDFQHIEDNMSRNILLFLFYRIIPYTNKKLLIATRGA
jgi:hypothetical protein